MEKKILFSIKKPYYFKVLIAIGWPVLNYMHSFLYKKKVKPAKTHFPFSN